MTEYRASFDADVTFLNGGGLRARGFRLDIPDAEITVDAVAELFVKHLGLLVDRVLVPDEPLTRDVIQPPTPGAGWWLA